MAALDFPSSPALDDVYTANGTSFQWDGAVWRPISSTFINDGAFVYYDGPLNVGIGTQTPSTKLQVAGTITATAFVGSGTGISNVDAATLDGIDSTQFLRNDQSDTLNGNLTIVGSGFPLTIQTTGAGTTPGIDLIDPTAATFGGRVYFDDTTSNLVLVGVNAGTEVGGITIDRDTGNVTVNAIARFTGDVLPSVDNTGVVGSLASTWANGRFTSLTIDSVLNVRNAIDLADNDVVRWGSNDDARMFYDGTNNTFELELESASTSFIITDNGTTRFTFDKATGNLNVNGQYQVNGSQIDTDDVLEGSNLYFTNERVDDRVAALLIGGTGITLDYNDTAGTLTINGSTLINDTDDVAEGSSNLYFTEERVDDRVNSLLVAGTNITLTYDDGANTLTIDAASGGGGFDLSSNDLTDVGDVSATGLGDAHFLIYDSTTTTWRPYNITGDVVISDTGVATIQNNSVALGINTTGNYIATIAGTANEIEVSGSGSETAAVIIGLPNDVTVTGTLTVGGDILPPADGQGLVGTSALTWSDGHFTNFQVDSVLNVRGRIDLADNDAVTFGTSDDFRIFYDGTNNTAEMELETAATSFIITDNGTTRFTFTKATGNLTASSFTGNLIGNADTATALETARTIGGVSFNGTANINLPGVNIAGNQNTSGNAATATALQTARTISLTGDATGSVSFDGSGNVSINTTVIGGSVNDADTLDGVQGANYARTDISETFTQDVIITGDLTVNGTTTTVNSNTVNIGDNIIVLNADETGTPSQDGGIEIERGTGTNRRFIWDESTDRWSTEGQNLDANTFIGALSGNATTASTLQTARTITLNGDVSGSTSFNGGSNVTLTATVANNSHTHVASNITAGNLANGVNLHYGNSGANANYKVSFTDATTGTAGNRDSLIDNTGTEFSYNPSTNTLNVANVAGNASTASTLETARTISLAGDLSGSASFNGGSNVTITATVGSNAVALGTNTTGNYVATIAGTANEIEVSGSGSETAAVTIGLPDDVTVTGQLTVGADLVPDSDNTGAVGTTALTWSNGQFTNLQVNSTLTVRAAIDLADNDQVRWGSSDDFRMFYDGTNNTMEMELESASTALIITDNTTERFRFAKSTGVFTATGAIFKDSTTPVPGITVADAPPGTPDEGDLWYNTDNGSLYVYYTDATPDSYWVEAGGNTGQGSSGAGGSSPFVDTGTFVYYGGPNNVGIGTATPGEALEVIGNIEASEDVIAYSDRRYKEDIETIDSALNIIAEMRGVRYTKKSTGRRSVGVIAQEVQEVLPEVVHADADGMLSVAYGNIVGVLVEAVKEQKTEIDLLKEQMAALIKRVNKLDGN